MLLDGVPFLPESGPNDACRIFAGVWETGLVATCREWSGALVRRHHGHGAASCASGGGRSMSCTLFHRACAVRCAGAVRVVILTDAWWTHAVPRPFLAGA